MRGASLAQCFLRIFSDKVNATGSALFSAALCLDAMAAIISENKYENSHLISIEVNEAKLKPRPLAVFFNNIKRLLF